MTKVETLQFLVGSKNVTATIHWTDENIMKIWNSMYEGNSKRFRLIKIGDEFQIKSYTPISDFTKDAMQYFLLNQ